MCFCLRVFDIVIVCVTEIRYTPTSLQVLQYRESSLRCTKYPMHSNKDVHFIVSLRPAAITVAVSLRKPLSAVMWSQFYPSLT